jgi:hypothetical protein
MPIRAQVESTSSPPTGPSLKETAEWISTDFTSLARYVDVTEDTNSRFRTRTETVKAIEKATLVDCRLSLTLKDQIRVDKSKKGFTLVETIPLADVDMNGFEVKEARLRSGETRTQPVFEVTVRTRRDAGDTIVGSINGGANLSGDSANIPVISREAADRITNVLRHAAKLCGAKPSVF